MTIILWSSSSSPVHRLPQPWRHPHLRLLPPPLPQVSRKILDHFKEIRRNTKVLTKKAFSENVLFVSGLSSGHSCLSMKQVKYHKIVEELRRAQMSIFCAPGSFLHRAYGWNLTVNERLEFLNLWCGAFL